MMIIMRYTPEHKQAVRERIVRAAAKALRTHGIDGVGIPALMKEVGLTHGGFYSHFADRDELVAEAIRFAGASTSQGALSADKSLDESLQLYLSMGHVEHREQGCVVAALAAEGSRDAKPVRRALAEVARGLIRQVASKVAPSRQSGKISDEALRTASTMIGAVVLARAVDDAALAERILRAARA